MFVCVYVCMCVCVCMYVIISRTEAINKGIPERSYAFYMY